MDAPQISRVIVLGVVTEQSARGRVVITAAHAARIRIARARGCEASTRLIVTDYKASASGRPTFALPAITTPIVVPPRPPAQCALLTRTLTPAPQAVRVVLVATHRPQGLPLPLPVFMDLRTQAHPALQRHPVSV